MTIGASGRAAARRAISASGSRRPVGALGLGKITAPTWSAPRQVVVNADREVVGQRHGLEVDAVEAAVHRVEAVGDVREEQRRSCLSRAWKVWASTSSELLPTNTHSADAEMAGDGGLELAAGRVGVELEAVGVVAEFGADRRQHGGWAGRGFRWC
jgi:hypothetical protein